MKMYACLKCQNDVSGCDSIFYCIADSRKSQSSGILIIIHTAIPTKINILAVIKKRNATFCCDFHCFSAKCCVHYRFSIFRNSRDSGLCHSPDVCKFRSFLVFCSCSGLKYMDARYLCRLVMYIIYSVRIIDGGSCIGHGNHGCHTAAGCCRRTAHDIFLMCLSRITKMHVKINNSRHY